MPSVTKTARASVLARLSGDRSGSTAVEFAIVATPFFMLLFAVLEVTFVFFINTTLENATMEAARRIRTGELQMAGASGSDFRDAVCDNVSVLVACDGKLFVDIRVFEDFDSARGNSNVSGGDFDDSNLQEDFGEAGDIVLARAYYVWDVFTPDLGTGLSNLNGGKRLIVASTAFRNEPFGEIP